LPPSARAERDPVRITPVPADAPAPRALLVREGKLSTEPGLRLKLSADLGSVRIFTLQPGEAPVVRYTVKIETDAVGRAADKLLAQYSLSAKSFPGGVQITGALPLQAARARATLSQFWVHFEVAVPRNYSVEVSTGAGDVETPDLHGAVVLVTQGGNIRCGKIGAAASRVALAAPAARLETQGGHIFLQDVAGDLDAFTGGGHINAGTISGDAKLHSGGGHIRAVKIGGKADLSTDGGNITVGRAGGIVAVRTVGGQIDFGEVQGSVRAQTGGGGIRITYVAGPMEVETTSGSICLTRVAGSVRAATAGGTITAFINPEAPSGGGAVRLAGTSQLSSGLGDIVVYLPRNLAATIDAVVESGGEGKIQSDPSLPLKIQTDGPRSGGSVHASGMLNGGGAVLRLRTTSGNIQLLYLDSSAALHTALVREQLERINHRLQEVELRSSPLIDAQKQLEEARGKLASAQQQQGDDTSGWFNVWLAEVEERLRGGVGEDSDELQKRVVYSPAPAYPKIAVQSGIQGFVKLQVRVGKDGRVEVLKVLQGEPLLVQAATAAVKQWRYRPRLAGGQPVNVISEVSFNFQLH
jgi:TonB family protein